MTAIKHIVALAVLLALPAAANPIVVMEYPWANGLPGIGLVPGSKTVLKIASEDLVISTDQVRIRYVLVNDTATPRHDRIQFPLPEIKPGEYWYASAQRGPDYRAVLGAHGKDTLNFVNFRVRIDGKPVTAEGSQIALVWDSAKGESDNWVDATNAIRAAGLPLLMFEKTGVLDRMPDTTRRALYDRGILWADEDAFQPGSYPKRFRPAWRVLTNFSWAQDFAAHGRVTVDITYRPMTGGTLKPVAGNKLSGWPEEGCFTDRTWPAWTPMNWQHRKAVSLRTASYVLTTAKFWNGPIGRFHLTLDKQKPDALLSACVDHPLKQTSPTTYEFTAERYAPASDIFLAVLD